MQYEVELVVDERAILGEGPTWDSEKKVLYWVDILGRKIHCYDPTTQNTKTITLDQYVGAAVPNTTGGLVLALQHGFYSIDLETEELTPIHDPEEHLPNNRFNDGKCDAAGRFWAGTMSLSDEANVGNFYRLDVDHKVNKMVENVTTSNGIAWSPDNKTMYYIDTPTCEIVAYDFDLETGSISNKRVAIKHPKERGFPDGMTIDAEGMLWVATWSGAQVCRWNPHTGELLESVKIPSPLVTSCCFGGDNLDELYITTARVGLNEKTLEQYPHAGSLFKIKTNVKGQPMHPFRG
ncbi:SMP-30/gluconolactonase/LRE family protein [Lederbergia graminis]|uniref:Regucalcin n=1 Tax=Lederbergia graminis TaxID=735518 RepID=A0ABW0LI05_9BACI|nr:SMP-30/gluconolactonase/LRE family protein [Paenibacillus bovis]HLU21396.1 SMP-30/gluconolactonase/LRE family protein [Bacillaceae bacterium]